MKADTVKEFNEYRRMMNERLLAAPGNKIIKRIFGVDTLTYRQGALDVKTKEMMELFGIAGLVGDTIVIPHTRRTMEFWEELVQTDKEK